VHTSENYLQEILNIIFIQKRLILWVAAFIFAVSIGIAFFWPPQYEVSGIILVKNRQFARNPQNIEEAYPRASEVDREIVNSEMKIMSSPELVRTVLVDLKNEGKFLARFKDDSDVLDEEFDYVMDKMKIEMLPESNTIKLSIRGRDPVWLNQFLGRLMDQYLLYRSSIYNPTGAEAFYRQQADRFKNDITAKNTQLINLITQSKVANPGNEIVNNLEIKKALEQELEQSLRRKNDLEKNIQHIDKLLSLKQNQFFSSIENKTIYELGVKLQNMIVEKNNLLMLFTPDHVKVIRVNEAIDRTYDALKKEVLSYKSGLQNQLDIEEKNVERLEKQIGDLTKRNMEIRAVQIQEDTIQTEKEVLKQSFQIFIKRTEEAKIANSSDVDGLFYIGVVNKPELPTMPIFPKPKIVIPIGFVLALLIGCSVGFWVEYCDHTLKTPIDIEKYAGLPTLFSIPEYDGTK
jgi:uncharacterized protein involved in exopolysaccharide biosynthesis